MKSQLKIWLSTPRCNLSLRPWRFLHQSLSFRSNLLWAEAVPEPTSPVPSPSMVREVLCLMNDRNDMYCSSASFSAAFYWGISRDREATFLEEITKQMYYRDWPRLCFAFLIWCPGTIFLFFASQAEEKAGCNCANIAFWLQLSIKLAQAHTHKKFWETFIWLKMEKRQSEGLVTCSACTFLLHPSSQWWTELRFPLRKEALGRKSTFFTRALPRLRHSRIRKCRRFFLFWMSLCYWVTMCCATFKTTGFKSKLYNFDRSWLQALKTWRIAWTKWNSLSLWLLSFATPPWM